MWVIDAQNIITPTSSELLAPRLAVNASHHWTGTGFEWGGYVGIPLLLVILTLALVRWRSHHVRWLSVMLLAGLVLSLGPSLHVGGHDTGIPLLWKVIVGLPLGQDVLAARFAVFPAIAAALLLAIAVDGLVVRRLHAAAGVVAAAVALSLLPAPLPAQRVTVPPFFAHGMVDRLEPGSVALVAPYANPFFPQPMIWQAVAGMRYRMPEGYVSLPGPAGNLLEYPQDTVTAATMAAVQLGMTPPTVDTTLRQAILRDLRRWGARAVIVGPMPHSEAMVKLFAAVLGRPPIRAQGVAVWWQAG